MDKYIIMMTFYEQKKLSIAFSTIDKEKLLSEGVRKKRKYF